MKRQTKKITYGFILLSFVLSVVVAGFRLYTEANNKDIQIAVYYEDMDKIRKETGETFNQILEQFKVAGANTLVVKSTPEEDNFAQYTFSPSLTYKEDFQVASDLGYRISPSIRTWTEQTDESMELFLKDMKAIPSLSTIYFEDKQIPLATHQKMIQLIKEQGLGFIEFYSPWQEGFRQLAEASKNEKGEYQVVRMYTDEKVPNISTPDPVARYELALTERGIRVFVFGLQGQGDSKENALQLARSMEEFTSRAVAKGYEITSTREAYHYFDTNSFVLFLIGLGTIAVIALCIQLVIEGRLYLIVGVVLTIGYGIGLLVAKQVTLQGMGFLATVFFPTYGIIRFVQKDNKEQLGNTLQTFFQITGITFIGCIQVVGLLSQASYALGIERFRGVKLAHLLPILFVTILLFWQNRETIKLELKQILHTKINYKLIVVCLLIVGVIGVIGIYVMRTGNGNISDIEKIVRQELDRILGVRPRTKEFLIGHPLMITLLYFGYKNKYWPALVFGTIGQISIINTYAHIHTPLLVSLIRSAYGLGIGIIIGIILIGVVKFIFKVINKWIIRQT